MGLGARCDGIRNHSCNQVLPRLGAVGSFLIGPAQNSCHNALIMIVRPRPAITGSGGVDDRHSAIQAFDKAVHHRRIPRHLGTGLPLIGSSLPDRRLARTLGAS
jgi:hypothetical protein